MTDQLPTPIGDALARGDGIDLLVKEGSGQDLTASVQARKELGKGWTFVAAAEWAKQQWSAWAGLFWRP